ncbi:hypothetical protein VIGAN_09081000 [Vigna angularis var. angularis]|uniref:Uncharacterized protein n=1 Tax=Vigna angularis var. angularis TaxID=157739 RepID=A0A0S3SWZ8_PHAAN|nr:hypothetical protein VIGAN_09081000 [Vigna angularis var. angularis]
MARFFCLLMNRPEGSIGPLTVQQANIPSQPNLHDCGVKILKATEIWDGDDKYNGKNMPQYTTVSSNCVFVKIILCVGF